MATPARAQSAATGSVSGEVTDPQNAAVPGAAVRLTDLGTNAIRSTTTNDAGRYEFANVPPGRYDLTISKAGFSQSKVSAQTVEVGLNLTLNAVLQVGATATTVEVTASAGAELQTLNATVGSTVSGDSIVLLPNLNRDASSLSVLQVGVAPGGQVAGMQSDQNAFLLDGGNNSDDMAGTNSTYTPSFASNGAPTGVVPTPVESVEEFKVGVSNQTADFNGAAGMQVQLVTKRGTKDFHGALYEYYFASDVGAANSWKNDHTPSSGLGYTPLPKTHRNRFGGALGARCCQNWPAGRPTSSPTMRAFGIRTKPPWRRPFPQP